MSRLRTVTLGQFVEIWMEKGVDYVRRGAPKPDGGLKSVPVIFPDGSPVRRIEATVYEGQLCLVVSGEADGDIVGTRFVGSTP